MPLIKVQTLGPFRVWLGDELIVTHGRPAQKVKELFAVLLTRREHAVSADQLMDLIWPDLLPDSAANSLRVAVSHLRRILQPDLRRGIDSAYILTCEQGYRFRSGSECWIDADAFLQAVGEGEESERQEQWQSAVAAYQSASEIYRGDYLEEHPYAEWTIAPREHLRETSLDALGRLAECHARQGHYRRALSVCRQILAMDPLRESAYRQEMIFHYRLGQRDQALRAYERCKNVLVAELGVDPMPETADLHAQILRDELAGGVVAIKPAAAPVLAEGWQHRSWLPLAGRDGPMELLVNRLSHALAGEGQLALITGEVGVGKSRLAYEFLARAEENGVRVFRGQACQMESDLPYQPVREALRLYLLSRLANEEMRRVLGSWMPHVALLLPELRQLFPDLSPLPPLPLEDEQQRLLEGLVQFCLSLAARRPVVFFIDDLHWADRSTLRFLHCLARRIAPARVLILATYLPSEVPPDHALHAIEREFQAEHSAIRIELERLPPVVVVDMVARRAADTWHSAAFGRRLYDETEGSPLFLAELLRSLFDAGLLVEDDAARWQPAPGADLMAAAFQVPPSVQALIEARCGALDSPGQRVLWAAAVVGRSCPFALLQDVTGLRTEELLDGLDALIRRQLMEEVFESDPVSYRFTHHKIREVVYAGLSPPRRIHLHQAVAHALEGQFQGHAEQIAGQLAHHYAEAREASRAVDYWLLAGDRARLLYAHQEAIAHYRRALAILRQQGAHERAARTLMKLGLTHQIAFEHQQARQMYDEGLALWCLADKAYRPEVSSSAEVVLRVDWPGSIRTLDPHLAVESMSAGVVDQLFSGLVAQSPDLEVIPDSAERWEVDADGCRYLFHLRRDASWSDGAPLTAYDFEYAWRRVLHPAIKSPVATILYDIKGAKAFQRGELDASELGVHACDPHTLSVELEAPSGYFLHLLTHHAALPVPPRAVEARQQEWAAADVIVTNGPFCLQRWEFGRSLVLVRNPRYRGARSGNVERVEMRLDSDAGGSLALYEAGELDILHLEHALSPLVERAWERHAGEYLSTPRLQTAFLAFNTALPPFDDVRVRQALVLAVDQTTLVDTVLRGFVAPATGGFIPTGMPGHSPAIGLPYDVERAHILLAEAGYPDSRGFPRLMGVVQRNRHWELVASYLEQQWRQHLGIRSEWELVLPGRLIDRVLSSPPPVFGTGWFADYPDPDNFMRACRIRHRIGWQNLTYESLVARAARVADQLERLQLYQQADQLLVREAALVPLSYGRLHRIVQPWVKRLPTSPIKWWFWKDVVIERT